MALESLLDLKPSDMNIDEAYKTHKIIFLKGRGMEKTCPFHPFLARLQ